MGFSAPSVQGGFRTALPGWNAGARGEVGGGAPKHRPRPSRWKKYDIVDERHAIVDGSTVDVFKETPDVVKVGRIVKEVKARKITGFEILYTFDENATDVVKRVLQLRAYIEAVEKLQEIQLMEEEEALIALLLEI